MNRNANSSGHFVPFARCVAFAALLTLVDGASWAATINVTTFSDEFNTGSSGCSLREAVQAANTNVAFGQCPAGSSSAADVINLPSGFYTLSRGNFNSTADIDEDGNSLIDIDIAGNLTIQGATTSATLSIGNTSGDYRGRIIHVLSGNVSINDVTLRDGNLPNGRFGGGLRSNTGTTVTLNGVRVFGNDADGGAGGILNAGTMTLNGSVVDQNKTTNAVAGGGGIYNAINSVLILNNCEVLDNRTEGNGANGSGAGIYSDTGSSLTLNNSTVDANIIAIGGVLGTDVVGDGGGIYSLGTLTLVQSTVSNNVSAGNFSKGGGIYCAPGVDSPVLIERSLIFANQALKNPDIDTDQLIPETASGGGMLADTHCDLTLRDAIFSANSADGKAGGLFLDGAAVKIERSLIVGNVANNNGVGGGIASQAFSLTIINSTVLNNSSSSAGGGLFVSGISAGSGLSVDISSSTIVGNISHTQIVRPEFGGGGGISSNSPFLVALSNTIIAGNLADGAAIGDDCKGEINLRSNNLIQTTIDCAALDANNTDKLNVNAMLAAATNNGGLVAGASNGQFAGMLTRAPQSASPLVDAGAVNGCEDADSLPLATDQIGRIRAIDGNSDGNARCDIGAIEFSFALFTDSFE